MAAKSRARSVTAIALVAIVVACAVVVAQNVVFRVAFPHLSRVATDYSPAYLGRELHAAATAPPAVIFLGDSVVWGYQLRADQTAVSVLAQRGCLCRNFAFKNGSPPNFYALVRLIAANGVRPKAVVMEVNQKVLNAADPSYNTLHPALNVLARPLLSPGDLAALTPAAPVPAFDELGDRLSGLYAMRADVRAIVFGETSDAPSGPLTPDAFEGTYDMTPLKASNAGVHFIAETAAALHAAGIPLIAFFTPANHKLVGEYIDNDGYRKNAAFLRSTLERNGARVLDLDAAFPAAEFIDNDHLTAAGQRRLANALAPLLPT